MDLKTWHAERAARRMISKPRKLEYHNAPHCRTCKWASWAGVCQRALAPNYGSQVKDSIGCTEHPQFIMEAIK